ncbi:MAG: hypothetical protein ABJF88_11555 [Rhodothermales bacterium]
MNARSLSLIATATLFAMSGCALFEEERGAIAEGDYRAAASWRTLGDSLFDPAYSSRFEGHTLRFTDPDEFEIRTGDTSGSGRASGNYVAGFDAGGSFVELRVEESSSGFYPVGDRMHLNYEVVEELPATVGHVQIEERGVVLWDGGAADVQDADGDGDEYERFFSWYQFVRE